MAKRYGRNQRRRHRQEIGALGRDLARSKAAHAYQTEQTRQLAADLQLLRDQIKEWDAEICDILGAYSAMRFKTPSMQSSEPIYRLPIQGPVPRGPVGGSIPTRESLEKAMVAHLKLLRILAEDDIMRLRHIVRLVVERPDGREELHFAYAIDGHDLMRRSRREIGFIVKKVAEDLYAAAGGHHG